MPLSEGLLMSTHKIYFHENIFLTHPLIWRYVEWHRYPCLINPYRQFDLDLHGLFYMYVRIFRIKLV